MKITIVIPPEKNGYGYEGTSWYFPSGPGYVAAALRDEHDVRILELRAQPKTKEQIMEWLKTDDSDVYCLGGLASDYEFIKWFASLSKKTTIVGGEIASCVPHLLMKDENIDFLIIGEADITIKDLIKAIENKSAFENIKGIAVKGMFTPPREPCDINSLPYPAYDLFPMEIYLNSSKAKKSPLPKPYMTIISSRGCPFKCTFCHRKYNTNVSIRSARSVVDEMKFLRDTYHIKSVPFFDDLFISNINRVKEFCKLLREEDVRLNWYATVRANLITEEMLVDMMKSGCLWVSAGIESVTQSILDKAKKATTINQIERLFEITNKLKIRLESSFIFGLPGENDESIHNTINFFNRHDMNCGGDGFFIATPFPGTELWDMAVKMGKITPENEEDYIKKISSIGQLIINFTDWSDEEFMQKKKYLESQIRRNYYRRHPVKLLWEYTRPIVFLPKYFKKYGFKTTSSFIKKRWVILKEVFKWT